MHPLDNPNPPKTETKRVEGYILRTTEKAIQFECHSVGGLSICDENGNPQIEWFPRSQIQKFLKVREQSEMDWMEVPTWLLSKKEMI